MAETPVLVLSRRLPVVVFDLWIQGEPNQRQSGQRG